MRLWDRQTLFALAASAAAVFETPNAWAHAHLVSSAPAAQAVVDSPSNVTLRFTEALESKFSGFEISDAHGAKVNAKPAPDPTNGAILVAPLAAPLPAGVYEVSWHIVAKDGHRMRGAYTFTVR